jgi:hypothetical protein
MRINSNYKIREIAGETIIVNQGTANVNMTRIISLNESALYLWNALAGREFSVADVANLLAEYYGIDDAIAERDAARWVERLEECALVE